MKNIGAPDTGLDRFISALAATAAEVAPVAETQAEMFVSLDTTFGALAEVARPFIQESISEGPPTEDVTLATLPTDQALPRQHGRALQRPRARGGRAARRPPRRSPTRSRSAPRCSPTRRSSTSSCAPTAESLEAFNDNPGVRTGLAAITAATDELGPALSHITPAQTVCNYGSILTENLYGLFSDGNESAAWQRFIVFDVPTGPEQRGLARRRRSPTAAAPTPATSCTPTPIRTPPRPGQTRECEAGNEPYTAGRAVIGNPPGNQGTATRGQIGPDAPAPPPEEEEAQ